MKCRRSYEYGVDSLFFSALELKFTNLRLTQSDVAGARGFANSAVKNSKDADKKWDQRGPSGVRGGNMVGHSKPLHPQFVYPSAVL